MSKYLIVAKNSLINALVFKFHFYFTFFANLVFILIIYFLWRSIYQSSSTGLLNGMTFHEAFVYLSLASAIAILMTTWVDFEMSHEIISGKITMVLIRPYDYQLRLLFESLGLVFFNLVMVTLPTFIIMFIFFGDVFHIGINIVFFILSIAISFLISFVFDFIVGIVSFYTESIWGFVMAKESLILFLSGAIIPISFFPQSMQKVLYCLPFQAIFNAPLSILLSKNLSIKEYLGKMAIQFMWLVILFLIGRLFYFIAIKKVKLNGG